MPSPLPDRPGRLLAALPPEFTPADARVAAARVGVAPRTAAGYVRALVAAGAAVRLGRGRYARTDAPLDAADRGETVGPAVRVPRATLPQRIAPRGPLGQPALLFNRELSWVDFNWRVLAQALDERTPLAERVRFLAITANNLDEFVRKRIGGLRRQVAAGVTALSPDGRTPREQLRHVRDALVPMWATLHDTWEDALRPALARAADVRVHSAAALPAADRGAVDAHFERALFPLLTPLAVDAAHPFPFISNGSLSLGVLLTRAGAEGEAFARVKVPLGRGRFVPLPGRPGDVVALEDVIRVNVGRLFGGMDVVGAWAFRVTRNADLGRADDDGDEDLIAMISEELRERRFAEVVRVEVEADMPERVRALLARELEVSPASLWPVDGMLDLTGLFELAALATRPGASAAADARPALSFPPWTSTVPARLRTDPDAPPGAFFDAIRAGSVLVHHPFESFRRSVQRFVEEAAADPAVLAIKMTLYRTSDDSPIVRALVEAAERGKQVAVLIEVQARFDEENNIEWARVLEEAGVHVAYGLAGLKTHAKAALVVREEAGELRTYGHIGTGNYNPKTARLYTDLGLLTADEALGRDLVRLFHVLTSSATAVAYDELLVAPEHLRERFRGLIRREAREAKAGRPGRIVAKMNALDDTDLIRELYRASRAGVEVDLVVRGHCRLRPGVPGVSETVRVRSLVGRFLEHDRIYWFGGGGRPEAFIGSADWQRRNLDDRVEVIAPVREPTHRGRLAAILRSCLADDVRAWTLGADGRYTQAVPSRQPHDHQAAMMRWARAGGPPEAWLAGEP